MVLEQSISREKKSLLADDIRTVLAEKEEVDELNNSDEVRAQEHADVDRIINLFNTNSVAKFRGLGLSKLNSAPTSQIIGPQPNSCFYPMKQLPLKQELAPSNEQI